MKFFYICKVFKMICILLNSNVEENAIIEK